MKALLLLCLGLILPGWKNVYAQAGALDVTFGGGDGLVSSTLYAGQRSEGIAIAVQADSKIVVSASTRAADGNEYVALLRYSPEGLPDTGFNGSGKVIIPLLNGYSRTVLIQPDQKIVTVESFEDSLESKFALLRFLPNGDPDSTFDNDGMVIKSFGAKYLGAAALALQEDGKIVVAGYTGFYGDSIYKFYVARYLPNGSPDNGFDGDGYAMTKVGESYTSLNSVLIQPDGKIVIGGQASFSGQFDYAVVRYNPNGTLDQSFDQDGISTVSFSQGDDRIMSMAIQPDGKLMLAGYSYDPANSQYAMSAARLNPNGSPDNTFHGNGKTILHLTAASDGAYDMLLQPDGKIVLSGYAHSAQNGGADMALVRLESNGIPDFTFDGDGVAIYEDDTDTSSLFNSIALQPDGKIIGTGYAGPNALKAIRIARIISGLTTSTNDDDLSFTGVTLYPNPFTDHLRLDYSLDKEETIQIHIYDIHGRKMEQLMESNSREPGSHVEYLEVQNRLPAGSYFLSVEAKGWVKAIPVIIQ